VTKADAPFPTGASKGDWRFARSRKADDVNAEVREAVDQDGYPLFRIGLLLAEIPPGKLSRAPRRLRKAFAWDHIVVSLQEFRSRSVNLFRPDLTSI
jgi:hypothetical protein